MARIRPATRLKAPKFGLAGTAALNGRDVNSRGAGALAVVASRLSGVGRKATPGVIDGDWEIRSTAPGVIWAHDFRNEAEVANFRKIPNDFARASSSSPGGYSLNRNITVGVHDPILHARRVPDSGTASGFALEITNLGSTLYSEMSPTQMYIDLYDASQFPDPNDTPEKYYWLSIHADDESDGARALWPPDGVAGGKGIKECVTVRKKEGNRLWLAGRGHSYGEYSAGGRANLIVRTGDFAPTNSGQLVFEAEASNFDASKDSGWALAGGRLYFTSGPLDNRQYTVASTEWQPNGRLRITLTIQAVDVPTEGNELNILPAGKRFLAGTPVGQDSDGGWNRPFTALTAAINGRGSDDPGAGLPVRSDFVPVVQGQTYTEGLWGPAFYHTLFGPASRWDGEEFWMQWKVWFSPSRNDPLCPSGKQHWLDVYSIGANQEWVTGGPGWRGLTASAGGWQIDNRVRTYTNFGTTVAADQDYDWALGEWQTATLRFKPGYAQDHACPFPGSSFEDESGLTVDTSVFTPTNEIDPGDGIRKLTFETSLPQLYPYLPSASNPGPNGETVNRHDERYWTGGGWQMTWPTTEAWQAVGGAAGGTQFAGGTALCIGAQVIAGRMRWTFKQRGSASFTTGVPSHGHRMQMIPFDRQLATPPEYLIHEYDLWIKRRGQDPVQVYALRNYITPMGIPGIGKFSTYPPCFNGMQLTGYGNIWDNLAPRASVTSTRWAEIIFSKDPISWPVESPP